MNKFFFLILVGMCFTSFAQNNYRVRITEGSIYYFLNESKKMEYFITKKDGSVKTTVNSNFDVKGENSCNIYLQWLNPLRYEVAWKDSLYVDYRYETVSEFIKNIVVLFPLDAIKNASLGNIIELANDQSGISDSLDLITSIDDKIIFRNQQLSTLLFNIKRASISPALNDVEKASIVNLFNATKDYEIEMLKIKQAGVLKNLTNLYSLNDYSNVSDLTTTVKKFINNENNKISNVKSKISILGQLLLLVSTRDLLLKNYIISTYESVLKEARSKLKTHESELTNLKGINEIMINSISSNLQSAHHQGFFRNHSISYGNGQSLDANIKISEYSLSEGELKKKSNGLSVDDKFSFRKFDPVDIFASTGLFYSNVPIISFGVSQDSFLIQKETSRQVEPSIAAFLNFAFGSNSEFLRPMLQIGIDPTKDNPYILLGGGLVIPSSRFSISGGGILPFNQKLNKLGIGQKIESTALLNDDLSKRIDFNNIGWYFGIQYKF